MIYRNAAVRDIAWACFSPALMLAPRLRDHGDGVDNCALALTPQRRDWLATLDADPTPLLHYLEQRPVNRLGIYFERLWHFFLQADPATELVAHNLPVRNDGATLGEFDCLYFCHQRGRHVHLELAVKYYLGWQISGQPAWLGPNSADRLDLKVERMLGHQSALGLTEPGRRALAGIGITDYERELEIKGYLFQPSDGSLPEPPGYNSQQTMSTWIRLNTLAHWLSQQKASSYRLLSRLQWLAPARETAADLDTTQLLDQLQARLEDSGRPALVAAFAGSGEETARFFVVSERWPDTPA